MLYKITIGSDDQQKQFIVDADSREKAEAEAFNAARFDPFWERGITLSVRASISALEGVINLPDYYRNYTVRYESDGQVTRIYFNAARDSAPSEIVRTAAGFLFLNDCCPGEKFCVYRDDDKAQAVMPPTRHHYYLDSDDLWPSDESEILDG